MLAEDVREKAKFEVRENGVNVEESGESCP